MTTSPTVAVVGTGIIGRSWLAVFLRAGWRVRVWDPGPGRVDKALHWIRDEVALDTELVEVTGSLAETLAGADYVQESSPETLESKRTVFAQLDGIAAPQTILASSTSTHDMSRIADGLDGADRCVVAHPVNPPHLVPVVEVLGGVATTSAVVNRTCDLLTAVGQEPVVLDRFINGFVLNRLQAALLREAIHLVDSGVASVAAVDAVVRSGLGPRWAFMGPFETAHTNDDDGIGGYLGRYSELYRDLMNSLGDTPNFTPELLKALVTGMDEVAKDNSVSALQRRRDERLSALARLKHELD